MNIYIIDFAKRMFRKANIPVLIYLILNLVIICGLMAVLSGGESVAAAIFLGLAVYAVSLMIALSPIGEWCLRLQTGCRKIKNQEQLEFLMPIFNRVYAKAKQADPSISDNVKLFINRDECPNAFATGRKTICVTAGLLSMPADQIEATLAHEFGHLAHKDTDLILVVTVGNMIFSLIITFIKLIIWIVEIGLDSVNEGISGALCAFLSLLFVDFFVWFWTKIGSWLVLKSSRSNEYEADEFAFRLGYGDSLCDLLSFFDDGARPKGLFATLASSHPESADRIARIRALASAPQINTGFYGQTEAPKLDPVNYGEPVQYTQPTPVPAPAPEPEPAPAPVFGFPSYQQPQAQPMAAAFPPQPTPQPVQQPAAVFPPQPEPQPVQQPAAAYTQQPVQQPVQYTQPTPAPAPAPAPKPAPKPVQKQAPKFNPNAMMYCTSCGQRVDQVAKFCPKCGGRIAQ